MFDIYNLSQIMRKYYDFCNNRDKLSDEWSSLWRLENHIFDSPNTLEIWVGIHVRSCLDKKVNS